MYEVASALQAQTHLKETAREQITGQAGQTDFLTVLNRQKSGASIPMDTIFEAAAARYDIPLRLLKAVAKAESGFNPNARSGAGAMGVMQLMPGTARSLGVTDPYDPWQNIMGGAKYLKENLDRFGDVSLALAAYNAGPGAVQKYGGVPPYRETQNYVRKIMADYTGSEAISSGRTVASGVGRSARAAGEYADLGADFLSAASLLGGTSGGTWDLTALYSQAQNREGGLTGEDWANLVEIVRLQMMMDR